jgi:hypothetical protein
MWTNPLTIALVSVGSTLLTLLVTPWLQHHFWKYQRRAELRLAAINEFNRLVNDPISRNLFRQPPPQAEWFSELNRACATIKALFSVEASAAAEKIDKFLKPGIGLQDAEDFVAARDAALYALYCEVISLPGRSRVVTRTK